MKIITRIGLAGVGPFKESAELTIQPGVTYLYGLDETRGGNGNAAGKSIFVSALAEIFYSPMVGLRQDRHGGNRWVEFSGERSVRIESGEGGNRVCVDGIDRTRRTATLNRELMNRLWTLTETEYRTYGYLDSQTPHPLVRGSTAERREFFSLFFGLDVLDAERRRLTKEANLLRGKRIALDEVERTLLSLKTHEIPEDERSALQIRFETLTSEARALSDLSGAHQASLRIRDFQAYAGTKIESARDLLGADWDSEEAATVMLRARLKDLRRSEENSELIEEYRVYRRDRAEHRSRIGAWAGREQELQDSHRRYQAVVAELRSLQKERPEPIAEHEEPAGAIEELRSRAYRLDHQIQHAEATSSGRCETCGQSVEPIDLERSERRMKKLRGEIRAHEEYARYKSELTRYREEMKEWRESEILRGSLNEERESLRERSEVWAGLRGSVEPERVARPEESTDPTVIRSDIETLRFVTENWELCHETPKKVDFDEDRLKELTRETADLRVRIELDLANRARTSEVGAQAKALREAQADLPALEIVLRGYSERSIKKMAVEAVGARLMSLLNSYSAIVFQDYRFEFSWDTQINLLVHRPTGVSDVRKLSGAESKLFTLILVLALLSFVPDERRLNMIVLDEPTASFSPETTRAFHLLLPHLQQLIPSILIVTPNSAERTSDAHEYTIVKTTAGSRIRRGHPSSFRDEDPRD